MIVNDCFAYKKQKNIESVHFFKSSQGQYAHSNDRSTILLSLS
jgi:hypothetical protein